MRYILAIPLIALLLSSSPVRAQGTTHLLKGYVFSQQDSTAIEGAIAYIDGSTLSALSSPGGQFQISDIPTGRRWLILEKPGYQSLLLPVQFNYGLRNVDTLYLKKEEQSLPSSFSKKELAGSMRKFRQKFFGQRNFSKVTVNNPEAFKITEKAPPRSDTPFRLQLTNNHLGYDISFWVRKFELSKERLVSSHYLEASMRFIPRKASSAKEQRKWDFNRESVYKGSLRHFLKHLIGKNLRENGFVCLAIEGNQSSSADKIRSGRRVPITSENLEDYVTFYPNQLRNINRLKISTIIEVRYTGNNGRGSTQTSYIIPATGLLQVYDNGLLPDPSQLNLSGYMAQGGISEMLPINY